MKVELFTLCEGAFNTNGRLTIVNTFEDIVSSKYPWRGQLGLALKLLVPVGEVGEFDISVVIQSLGGDQKLHEINAHIGIPQQSTPSDVHIAMASNIQGLLITKSGKYEVVISINGEKFFTYPFKAL